MYGWTYFIMVTQKHMEGQKEQALIRRRAFCLASDQNLDSWSHLQKTLFALRNIKTIYEYKYMEKADLGKQCLLLHKTGFSRWRNIYQNDAGNFSRTPFCNLAYNGLNGRQFNPLQPGIQNGCHENSVCNILKSLVLQYFFSKKV